MDIAKTLYAMATAAKPKVIPYWQIGRHQHDWHNLGDGIDEQGNHSYNEDVCIICLAQRPHQEVK